MRYFLPIILFLFLTWNISAQIGGDNVYEFLNLAQSARITAMGGHQIAVQDDDVAFAYSNPAALNPLMDKKLTFGTEIYFSGTGILHGYAGYGHHLKSKNLMLHGGIQYISYGSFERRDVAAIQMGNFKASEYAITAGVSRPLNEKLTAGANLKIITSQLGGFNSFGMAADLAMMYADTSSNFNASFVIKNAGMQFTTYEDEREPIPFEIQAGFSKKLKYLPFRISIIGTNLQRWNITYDDPNAEDETLLFGEEPKEKSNAVIFVDNFFRHVVVNGEFLFGKKENFRVRFGYNHLRRAELSLENLRSLAGMSVGAGFKIKRFSFDYGMGLYSIGGSVHHIGISTNINEFLK